MRNLFWLLALLVHVNPALAQPYGGTIFIEPGIIVSTDSSALQSVTYTGKGDRLVFDRRVNSWITITAFLFDVKWNDGLKSVAVINPEFEDVSQAQTEAEKYGFLIGQLPNCLRTDVNEIWIHKGIQPFGGGNKSILIHTGQSEIYERDRIIEETLVHEASHTSLDATHAASAGWLEAQNLDNGFISIYAKDFPNREDIAESFLLWMAVRFRQDRITTENYTTILQTIPNRLNYFDTINCNLYPVVIDDPTSIKPPEIGSAEIVVYPNPASDYITVKITGNSITQLLIFNSTGQKLIHKILQNKENRIETGNLKPGIYFMHLETNGKTEIRKLIINQ